MDGLIRSSSARRGRGGVARAALVAVFAVVALVAAPGTASAAGTVTPILDCYQQHSDGSWTVVVGYVNSTGSTQRIPYGYRNAAYPSKFQSVPPTTFKPGTQHGVFTVQVTLSDLYANARWELDGHVLNYLAAGTASSVCPPSAALPADGNGTGPVIALAIAGVVGGIAVQRVRRRAQATADVPAAAERDDA
jgi:hypothetical protein